MSEFDKTYYGRLKSNFDRAVNNIIGNTENLRQDGNARERSQFELILTYNNLVVYVNNHLPFLYLRTQRGIGATIQTARDRIEYCSKRLQFTIAFPENLFDRIESDIFDLSMDKIPSDFEISNNTTESLERTNIDGLNTENMNNSLNLARYSTPIRQQGQLLDMATKPNVTTTEEQISPTNPTEFNPIYTTAQIQTGTQMNHIPATAVHHNINNGSPLNQVPSNQTHHIENFPPITSTNRNINAHDGSPLNHLLQRPNEGPQRTQGNNNNNNTYNPFLPPQFSTQYNQPHQHQSPANEYYGLIMRSSQVLEQQANQLQQAARFNETLMNELRTQRESYHQLISNQMAINQNNTQIQQQTGTYTRQKIRPEYREILKSIPDFDGEKHRDLDNILHASELAFANADTPDELNAFYLTLKLHLKGHVYKTIYSDSTSKSWEDIKGILNRDFAYLKPDKNLINKQLETSRQAENETIEVFSKRILAQANKKRSSYNVFTPEQEEDLNELMIKTLMNGVKTERIKNKLSFFSFSKFPEYVSKAMELERSMETEVLNREYYCNHCNRNGHREINCKSKQEQTTSINQLTKLFNGLNTSNRTSNTFNSKFNQTHQGNQNKSNITNTNPNTSNNKQFQDNSQRNTYQKNSINTANHLETDEIQNEHKSNSDIDSDNDSEN